MNKKNQFKKFTNLYELSKTLRFELKPQNEKSKNISNLLEKTGDIDNLLKQFKEVQENFLDIFIYKTEQEESKYLKLEFKKNREIKYGWLRTYTKIEFYNWKKIKNKGDKDKKYYLTNIDYLPKEFLRWANEWQELIKQLENFTNKKEHEQERKSDIAFVLRRFLKRQNFEFIKEFIFSVTDLQDKNGIESDKKIQIFNNLLEETQKNLKTCEKKYLPAQSSGVILHKASLNYYTLNKTPKDYGELKDSKKKELKDDLSNFIFNRTKFNRKTRQKEILFECNSDWLVAIGLGIDIYKWKIDEAYVKLKKWKADQKSEFNEKINNFIFEYLKKGFNEEQINASDKDKVKEILKNFPLFFPKEIQYLSAFLKKTKEIKIKSEEKNEILQNNKIKAKDFEKIIFQKIKNKEELTNDERDYNVITKNITTFKKERWKFFNAPKEKIQTKNYYELCELFKRIATKRGKIIAEIKGLKNEEVQSQLLDHWVIVLNEDEKLFVVMIPRGEEENHKKAHDYLEQENVKNKKEGEIVLYHFKSLTLRALEKLCFKKIKNTFFLDDQKEFEKIVNMEFSFFDVKKIKSIKQKNKFKSLDYIKWAEENDEDYKKSIQGKNGQRNKYVDKKELISFYQKVLNSKYVKSVLDIVEFEKNNNREKNNKIKNIKKGEFNSLEEFESVLENVCYVKIPLKISVKQKEDFIERFDAKIFEITTRSIAGNKKENRHAEIWKEFWSGENEKENHIIRLNPEMSVFYREALDKNNGNRNRYSKSRFTLATTITLNVTEKKLNLAFKTTQDIKNHIDEFNANFNKNFKGELHYGIDRGLKELATLNIVKFSDEKNNFGISQPEKFAKIEVWKLKNENEYLKDQDGNILKNAKEENRKIIDNISCLEKIDEKFFEKKTVHCSCIDLTMAKLIKNKIILNGDKKTYLKLKELSARRRIFELFSTGKIDKNAKIKNSYITKKDNGKDKEHHNDGLFIECSDCYLRKIYWFFKDQKFNSEAKKEIQEPQKQLQKELGEKFQKYLNELDKKNKFEDIEKIEKINHLRDAITANMVGILAHLQEKIGKGIVALENMDVKKKEMEERIKEKNEKESHLETGRDAKMIDEHFDQCNQDISRRLEWALFRKFANTGGVPPQIKESILLRDDFKTYQFGILKFVKIEGTSSNCPNCEKRFGKSKNHFICKGENNCGFDSRENRNLLEQNLNNSDEVAAYNVAKNAFNKIYS